MQLLKQQAKSWLGIELNFCNSIKLHTYIFGEGILFGMPKFASS